jgi:HEAT repeat protein
VCEGERAWALGFTFVGLLSLRSSQLPPCMRGIGDVLLRAQCRGDVRAMTALLDVLRNDVDAAVQRAAVHSIWKCHLEGEEKTLATLMWAAEKHRDANVRKAAVESLEKLTVKGDPLGVECLSRCLSDAHAEVRESAVRALERAAHEGSEEAVAAAESMMQDESWLVRRAAARSLTMLEPEGERQTSVAAKVFGKEDKLWYGEVQGYLTKPLFYPI